MTRLDRCEPGGEPRAARGARGSGGQVGRDRPEPDAEPRRARGLGAGAGGGRPEPDAEPPRARDLGTDPGRGRPEPDLGDLVVVLLASTLAGLGERLRADGYDAAASLVEELVEVADTYVRLVDM